MTLVAFAGLQRYALGMFRRFGVDASSLVALELPKAVLTFGQHPCRIHCEQKSCEINKDSEDDENSFLLSFVGYDKHAVYDSYAAMRISLRAPYLYPNR